MIEMPARKVKYVGSELKRRMLEALVDPETGTRYSVREAIRLYPELMIKISNWNYYCKKDEIKNSEPYKGCIIDEQLAFEYYQSLGFNELEYDDFTNNTMKKKHMLDEHTLIRMNELELLGFAQSEALPLWTRKATLMVLLDENEEEYNKLNEKNKRKLLKRTGGK